jgi:tetrahydromethanopterin S-methyltransferase subunit H
VNVIRYTPNPLNRHLEFVASRTTAPLLVDSPSQAVRLEALRYFAGSEVMPRLIYNAIADDYTEEEIDTLRECCVRHAVALAFNTKNIRPAARINFLTETLLPLTVRAGIQNVLVDAGVLDIASLSPAALTIREVKDKLGYPSGCAPANALYTWRQGTGKNWDENAYRAVAASIMSTLVGSGANFIFYGSLALAPWLYPAVAAADALNAYAGRFTGHRPQVPQHPLHKML